MKVSISIDFDETMKQEICDAFIEKLAGFTDEQLENLEESFMKNISEGFMDLIFEVETNKDETEVTSVVCLGS